MEISKGHQQKKPLYRKTLSKSQFPTIIISASTLRNTNIVFPCKLCSKNINDSHTATNVVLGLSEV